MQENLPDRSPYRAEIDGLRAVAVLLVVLYHFRWKLFPGGYVGVDVFFVISGYLISSLILSQRRAGTFSFPEFWARRCRRLLPALALVWMFSLAAGWLILLPADLTSLGKVLEGQALLAANWVMLNNTMFGYFGDAPDSHPMLHTWSLALEEQFYLVFPFLLGALAAQTKARRSFVILAGIACCSFGYAIWQTARSPYAAFYLLPARLWELMLGCLLALLPEKFRTISRAGRECCAGMGLALILASAHDFDALTAFPGPAALLPCAGTVLFLAATGQVDCRTWTERLLGTRPMVFVGLISYSLYLWHWPLLAFAEYIRCREIGAHTSDVLLLFSLVLATLSWKLVEKPFRTRRSLSKRASLLGACLLAACSMMLGKALDANVGFPSRFSPHAQDLLATSNPYVIGRAVRPDEIARGDVPKIGDLDAGRDGSFLIWGDSHASVILPVLDELGREHKALGYAVFHAATPPLTHSHHPSSPWSISQAEVAPWGANTLELIRKNKIRKVILVALWSGYQMGPRDLRETLADLHSAGARVWIVEQVPLARISVQRAAILADRGLISLTQGISPPLVYQDRSILEGDLAEADPSMYQLLDPLPTFFDKATDTFPFEREGHLLYHDGLHISTFGAMQLRPLFEPLFLRN